MYGEGGVIVAHRLHSQLTINQFKGTKAQFGCITCIKLEIFCPFFTFCDKKKTIKIIQNDVRIERFCKNLIETVNTCNVDTVRLCYLENVGYFGVILIGIIFCKFSDNEKVQSLKNWHCNMTII